MIIESIIHLLAKLKKIEKETDNIIYKTRIEKGKFIRIIYEFVQNRYYPSIKYYSLEFIFESNYTSNKRSKPNDTTDKFFIIRHTTAS